MGLAGINRVRQPAGRIYVAKEYVSDGVAAFLTGPPGLHDGRNILRQPRDRQRAGAHFHDDGPGIRRQDSFHKFFLTAGQAEGFAVARFLFNRGGGANANHGHIGRPREGHRLRQFRRGIGGDLRRFLFPTGIRISTNQSAHGVNHLRARRDAILDALQGRDGFRRFAVVIVHHETVSHRPDHG